MGVELKTRQGRDLRDSLEELSELAREIEARRSGVYRLSAEERAAIDAARRGPLATDDEVEAFWKRRGLA